MGFEISKKECSVKNKFTTSYVKSESYLCYIDTKLSQGI